MVRTLRPHLICLVLSLVVTCLIQPPTTAFSDCRSPHSQSSHSQSQSLPSPSMFVAAAPLTTVNHLYFSEEIQLRVANIYSYQPITLDYTITLNQTSIHSANLTTQDSYIAIARTDYTNPLSTPTTTVGQSWCTDATDLTVRTLLPIDLTLPSMQTGSVQVPLPANSGTAQILVFLYTDVNQTQTATGPAVLCDPNHRLTLIYVSPVVTIYPSNAPIVGGAGSCLFRNAAVRSPLEIPANSGLNPNFITAIPYSGVLLPECSPAPFSSLSTAFAVEGWFRTVPVSAQTNQAKACCWDLVATSDFAIGLRDGGKPQFLMRNNPSAPCNQLQPTDTPDYRDNTWHHIAGIYRNGTTTLLMDGIVVASSVCDFGSSTNELKFNSHLFHVGSGTLESLEGWLDEIRVWGVERTPSQLSTTMHRHLFPEEILQTVWYLDFDTPDEDGLLLLDSSPSQLHIPLGTDPSKPPQFTKNRRLAPTWENSDCPIYGSKFTQQIQFSLEATTPQQIDLFLPAFLPANSSLTNSVDLALASQADSTVTILSLPAYVTLFATNNMTTPLIIGSTITVPYAIPNQPHSWSSYAPLITAVINTQDVTVQGLMVDSILVDQFTFSATMKGVVSPPGTVQLTLARLAPPVAGTPGGALRCDGVNDHAFASTFSYLPQNFSSTTYGLGAITIEFWALFDVSLKAGTVFSLGDTEVEGNWCTQLDTSKGANGQWNDKAEQDLHCVGRLLMHLPGANSEAFGGWNPSNDAGHLSWSTVDRMNTWTHIAIVLPLAEYQDVGSNMLLYINGQLSGTKANTVMSHRLDGFNLCHWPFYGDWHYFAGFLDEFKIWKGVRTPTQIRSHMHTSTPAEFTNDPNLLLYYTFNDFAPTAAADTNQTTTIGASSESTAVTISLLSTFPSEWTNNLYSATDHSMYDHTLVFGGCTPNLPPYCLDGQDKCVMGKQPSVPCYITSSESFDSSRAPVIVNSYAPVGGFEFARIIEPNERIVLTLTSAVQQSQLESVSRRNTNAQLQYSLPTHTFQFDQLPKSDIGRVYQAVATDLALPVNISTPTGVVVTAGVKVATSYISFVPASNRGGLPLVSLTYRVHNGLTYSLNNATIDLNVKCPPGTYLDNIGKLCVECPSGTYQATSSFADSCQLVPPGFFTSSIGSTSFSTCPVGTFSDDYGLSNCKLCDDYDFPSPCLPTSNLKVAAQNGLWALVGIIGFFILCSFIVVIAFRQHRVIFSSSPAFLIYALIGLAGLLISAALFIPNQTAELCTAKVWMLNISFQIFFSGLTLKTYRLHRIFNSKLLTSTKLTNTKLFSVAPVFILFDLIMLIAWTVRFPFDVQSQFQRTCVSDGGIIFVPILLASKGLLLAFAVYLCIKIWNCPARYNESKSLSLVLYNGVAVLLILIILWFGLGSSIPGQSIVMIIGILYFTLASTLLMFIPKCLAIFSEIGNAAWIKFRIEKGGKLKFAEPVNNGSYLGGSALDVSSESGGKVGTPTSSTGSTTKPGTLSPQELMIQLLTEARTSFERLKGFTTEHHKQNQMAQALLEKMNTQQEKCRTLEWEIEFLRAKDPTLKDVVLPPESTTPTASSAASRPLPTRDPMRQSIPNDTNPNVIRRPSTNSSNFHQHHRTGSSSSAAGINGGSKYLATFRPSISAATNNNITGTAVSSHEIQLVSIPSPKESTSLLDGPSNLPAVTQPPPHEIRLDIDAATSHTRQPSLPRHNSNPPTSHHPPIDHYPPSGRSTPSGLARDRTRIRFHVQPNSPSIDATTVANSPPTNLHPTHPFRDDPTSSHSSPPSQLPDELRRTDGKDE